MESKTIWIFAIVYSAIQHFAYTSTPLKRPRAGDPFDTFPKNFWQEFSSPFTDTPEDEELEVTEATTHEPFPFFADPYTTVNVSTQLGAHVFLHCRVNDLQGKTVSWMRRKGDDLALITFGRHTYSGDSRYSLEFEEPNDWKLLIQYANERDEGPYECQVSSHPPLVLLVYLTVIVPHVEILDERGSATPEKYYKAGSTIELQCVISKIPQPTSYITWRHNTRLLNYDTSRGGISVKTDMLPGRAFSGLYIANANRHDTGNYSCILGNDITGTVMVHVLNAYVNTLNMDSQLLRKLMLSKLLSQCGNHSIKYLPTHLCKHSLKDFLFTVSPELQITSDASKIKKNFDEIDKASASFSTLNQLT